MDFLICFAGEKNCVRNVYVLQHFETKQSDLFEVSARDGMGSWTCSISVGWVRGNIFFFKKIKSDKVAAVRVTFQSYKLPFKRNLLLDHTSVRKRVTEIFKYFKL